MVLSKTLQPCCSPAETIAGKWFPGMNGGHGGVVLITDDCNGTCCMHAYVSVGQSMTRFVPALEPSLSPAEHPPLGPSSRADKKVEGDWASDAAQIAFILALESAPAYGIAWQCVRSEWLLPTPTPCTTCLLADFSDLPACKKPRVGCTCVRVK
jgi:hypothetical protein